MLSAHRLKPADIGAKRGAPPHVFELRPRLRECERGGGKTRLERLEALEIEANRVPTSSSIAAGEFRDLKLLKN